jgi:hypothetical protein
MRTQFLAVQNAISTMVVPLQTTIKPLSNHGQNHDGGFHVDSQDSSHSEKLVSLSCKFQKSILYQI